MAEIWERQKNESSKAYAVFCVYRDLGPDRSLEKLRQNLDKPRSRKWLGDWSVKYNWVDRAAAYDDYIEKKKREEKEKEILDMSDRHARLAVVFQQKIAQALQQIDPAQLSPADMARWLDVATKLERLSRGEPNPHKWRDRPVGDAESFGQLEKLIEGIKQDE